MNETKHTPGPWKKDGLDFFGSNGDKVVVSDGPSFGSASNFPRAAANARLIAAAPDLLEALQRLSNQRTRLLLPSQKITAAEQNARDVIARATGATTEK